MIKFLELYVFDDKQIWIADGIEVEKSWLVGKFIYNMRVIWKEEKKNGKP